MPKSRSKIKKKSFIEISDEYDLSKCCSNRNCPSHWHNRLSEKLKTIQQTKLQTSIESKHQYQLLYSNILLNLFHINEFNENNQEKIYSKPISKTILLNKHQIYLNQITKKFHHITHKFIRNNLNISMNYRMISLISNPINISSIIPIQINSLRINHIHKNFYLSIKIISQPIWNHSAIHIIIQDNNTHCLRLSIYNYLYLIDTRQIKSFEYIQERLKYLFPLNSTIILYEPWLKQCNDNELSLHCETPNTHLILEINQQNNIEQLRQLGNNCYQADDNLSAIEFYSLALKQLDKQQENQLTLKGQSIGPKTDEYEQHRIRLLSNRCACYLRERQALLALSDSSILLSLNEFSHLLESPKITTGKLLFRYINSHLQLGLYDKVEHLLKSHQFAIGLSGLENPTSMTILEKELIRLKNEFYQQEYHLEDMLNHQQSSMIFIDLSHHHAEYQRNDLFQIRLCQNDKYPLNSYGIYALKNIDIGTLLIVEQPFASIDKRINNDEYIHRINSWKNHSKIQYYSYDILRLLNEIEKQLFIGNTTIKTFEKIQFMQPIRQWLADNNNKKQDFDEQSIDLLDNYQEILLEKNKWKKHLAKQLPSSSTIPWHVLFKTQQQNPFQSQSILGWYPLSSMLNHSCLPNCLWYLIGDYLFIYVCGSNVREGDELTISYCPLWISSINERTNLLRQYDIDFCQCLLCLYDRSIIDEYENELKKFSNFRALVRQKNLTNSNRVNYLEQLICQYEFLRKKYHDRPISFIQEFIDLELISLNFQNENQIKENFFLERLTNVCNLTLPHISNPLLLFGKQIQLLIDHLEQSSSSNLKEWNDLLEYLYDIYTFKRYSSSKHIQKTLKDYKQFFTNLFQTQTFIINEKKL